MQWFARGGEAAVMGPFRNQALASAALITVDGYPIEGSFVWPETAAQTKRREALYKMTAKKEKMK
jgi:hypothetical protein